MPGKAAENSDKTIHNSLMIVGSKSKYSAMPPHTPQIFLFAMER